MIDLPFATRRLLAQQVERYGWTIGDHTYGSPLVLEENYGHLEIGRFCSIAWGTTLVLGNHTASGVSTYPFRTLHGFWPGAEHGAPDHVPGDIAIGHDVWLGAHCMVLPGTTIGSGAIVGGHAVVRGTVPPYAIVAGNPARVVRYRFEPGIVAALLRIAWWDWDDARVRAEIGSLTDGDVAGFVAAHGGPSAEPGRPGSAREDYSVSAA